jgi:hypothetical protein
MRIAQLILVLLATLALLAGCGIVTNTAGTPPLTQARAVALAERYYELCSEDEMIGQCELLDAYSDLADTEIDPGMRQFVATKMQRQPDAGSVAQPDAKSLVLTPAGARFAVNMLFGHNTGVPVEAGDPATGSWWQTAKITIHPTSFVVHDDTATMTAVMSLSPNPLTPVLLREAWRVPSVTPAMRSLIAHHGRSQQKITLYFRYDYDHSADGVIRWQVRA